MEEPPRNLRELLLALRIAAIAVSVPALLRLRLEWLERVLEPRRRRPDARRAAWLAQRIDGVLAAGHPLVRPGCLTRGVTHYWFLRRAGMDVRLQFGVG